MKSVVIIMLMMLAGTVYAAPIGSLTATSNGNYITVSWISNDETTVREFTIERRVKNQGDYISIATIQAQGSHSQYSYVDRTANKTTSTTQYEYRIITVYSNSTTVASDPTVGTLSLSGVRRTWGSLKAMFR